MNEEVKGPRSLKRLLTAGCIAIVTIPLVALVLFALFRTSELNLKIAELRSQGLPTSAVELNDWYAVPPDVADTTGLWLAATTAVTNAEMDPRTTIMPFVGKGPTPVPAPGHEWAELGICKTFLDDRDTEIQLIMHAADAGGMARYPVDFRDGLDAILSAQQQTRGLARFLALRAHVHAHEGRHSEVLKDIKAIFAVSDSLRGEPLLISQLIRNGIHAIGCKLVADLVPHCAWNDEELEDLQTSIGKADFRNGMLRAFQGERVNCLTAIDSYGIVFRDINKLKAIELYKEFTEGLAISWQETTNRNQKIEEECASIAAGRASRMIYTYAMLLVPSMQQAANSGMRAEARQNCAIAAIAAYRYRLHHGTLPQSLSELQSLIPGDAAEKASRLIDSFDSQPLRFKSNTHQITIYSIGENKVDDDGDIEDGEQQPLDVGYSVTDQ
ncbi:MAG: hypothetical protein R3C17_16325 [Planctomycetaceae bacterium]